MMNTVYRCVLALLLAMVVMSAPASADVMSGILDKLEYREIGPTRQGGRVVSFAVDEDDPTTFFVAAGPGGVWKTENGGISFEAVFEQEAIASIGDIALAPGQPDIVWVGSGEANLRNSTYYGNGVYKSIDGGKSWRHMGLPESHHIGRILIHPENPDIVYVAAQGHLYSENAERGIYKTIDGGETWHKSLDVNIDGRSIGATEIRLKPDNPDVLIAVTYDRQRMPWGFRTAGPGSGIYKSTDAGASWRKLTNGLPDGMLGKIGVDLYAGDSSLLYATVDNANVSGESSASRWTQLQTGLPGEKEPIGHGIYRSEDSGENWHKVSADGESIGRRSNYYGQIIIDPNEADHLFVLSEIVQESHDRGKTWQQRIRYGGDNHVLWINPADSRHLMMGYDYGMAITRDAGQNWYHPDELSMAQIYAVGVDQERPYNVYVGMQDFGSWKGKSTKKGRFPLRFEDWQQVNGGDGFYNQVDPDDGRWLYSGSQFGHITRIDQKSGERKTIVEDFERGYRYNWNTPLLISPHDKNVLFVGAQKLRRSSSRGDEWVDISEDLSKADASRFDGVGAVRFGTITSIDQSAIDENILWVGTDDGNVQLSQDGGRNWQLLNEHIPEFSNDWVTRVIASRHDAATAYVTASGFHRDDFRPLVYRTTDFGRSWALIVNGIADESVNVLREDYNNPGLLFLGTDKAVYASIDSGKAWHKMNNGIPTIAVHDLVIHPRDNELVVGTHGRGVYITDVSPLQQLNTSILEKDAHLFNVEPTVQWRMLGQPAVSAQNFSGGNDSFAVDIHYYLRERHPGDIRLSVFQNDERLIELAGTNDPGLNTVRWFMTRSETRSANEQEEWVLEQAELAAEPEFFDYYDAVEIFPEADEEVDRFGRSMRTRVHPEMGITDRANRYHRVGPGKYRIELQLAGETFVTEATVLSDEWYE
ncbi:MAG: photosystem II stability/assembly factor-like uncharacterized protein [Woeseiaceae bacterium]|jgi:photosystem II stability/assembly factor-like uncharacterized protein